MRDGAEAGLDGFRVARRVEYNVEAVAAREFGDPGCTAAVCDDGGDMAKNGCSCR
ncbi:hypothetical protein D3C73_1631980 [compost metagenome]